jgi:hypothetical protein
MLLEYNDHLFISFDLVLVTSTNNTNGVQVAGKSILLTRLQLILGREHQHTQRMMLWNFECGQCPTQKERRGIGVQLESKSQETKGEIVSPITTRLGTKQKVCTDRTNVT